MPRIESRKPLQSGRTRVVRLQVEDDPKDKSTWNEEQHWSVLSPGKLKREAPTYPDKKLRKMVKYYRLLHIEPHRGIVLRELSRRRDT